jgi:poly-gamma-glutamate capsule biosynthesis protein CapA/YwtB (metallophosphatase superfamily)
MTGFSHSGPSEEKKLSLLFIGDIMGHDSQIWSAEDIKTGTYDFNDVFMYVKPLISGVDVAVANFEVTLAGPPYKGYPRFSSPAALAEACRNAGIKYLVTANNHASDRGTEGIEGTIHRLDSLGIDHTGTFLNRTARDSLNPLMIKKSSFSIALLNYTYGTNDLNIPAPLIINMLDRNLIASDIKKAKGKNPDLVILFLHWGNEYDTIPSKAQHELADYFFSLGADLIIGSHPHVLQKMVWVKSNKSSPRDRITVYSLGNFISNQQKPKTDGGSMVRIDLVKSGRTVSVLNAGYYLTWVYTPIINYEIKLYILPCAEFENNSDFFTDQRDYLRMMKFVNDSRSLLQKQNINFTEYIFKDSKWVLNK